MSIDDYYTSKITMTRLETVFQNGFHKVLELISQSPDFFNKTISPDDLFKEFVEGPIQEIKDTQKEEKEIKHANNIKLKRNKLDKCQEIDINKCHALIHIKREFRQCQNAQVSDDDFCMQHSKLNILPYGRVHFFDDSDDTY
jgi:hypothetical protein